MGENPLANVGELSKAAATLIDRIAAAVGGLFRPYQIVRVARAEAEAGRIQAAAEIEISDLHRRAFRRFLEEEAQRQTNMEKITEKAIPLLRENSSPQGLTDDWIANFFDKCRIVSDADMQRLWSRLLAGEANSPHSFSRQTVNLLGDLDKADAELFAKLCSFGWAIVDLVPLVFDEQAEIYQRHGVSFNSLSHLESLGLARFGAVGGFRRLGLPRNMPVAYFGKHVLLTLPKEADNELDIGRVLLTRAGQELASVCSPHPADGFFEFVYERWAKESLVSPESGAPATG